MLDNDYQSDEPVAEDANFRHVVASVAREVREPSPDPSQPAVISPPASAPALVSPLRAKMRRFFFFGLVIIVNLVAVLHGDAPRFEQVRRTAPAADALLRELAARPEVLALGFHVDYWDRLGWNLSIGTRTETQSWHCAQCGR